MVIMAKQSVLFLHPEDGKNFHAQNGYIGKCPEWVTKTRQFKEMVADGMIVATETSSDKELAAAEKKSSKKGKMAPEQPVESQNKGTEHQGADGQDETAQASDQ